MGRYFQHGEKAVHALAILSVVLSVAGAAWLATAQSQQDQLARVSQITDDLLYQSERVVDQQETIFRILGAADFSDPCAPAVRAQMRSLLLKANLLSDVGYIRDDQLRCSAFVETPMPVGRIDYLSRSGFEIRSNVAHPLAPELSVLITSDPRSGYATLLKQDAPLQQLPQLPRLAAGLLGVGQEIPILQQGRFHPEWLPVVAKPEPMVRVVGDAVVAWKPSLRYAYGAYAVLPRSAWDAQWRQRFLMLAAVGISMGLVLAWALLRLARQRTSMPALLRQGLAKGELFLVCQPVVELATGRWVGAEVLVRWRRLNGELVPPDVFIPMAEQHKLIGLVTAEVMRLLECEAGAVLQQHPDFHFAINLAADDFCNPALPGRLHQLVQGWGGRPANLQVEATERVFMDVEATRTALSALRAAGIAVAIDDFGTGYSSLSYLTSLDMDLLKIDKSFVDTIGTEAVTSRVVDHIIEMAKSLHLKMVAEGVETQVQADWLRARGVQYGQGWLFARPMPMQELRQQLAQRG